MPAGSGASGDASPVNQNAEQWDLSLQDVAVGGQGNAAAVWIDTQGNVTALWTGWLAPNPTVAHCYRTPGTRTVTVRARKGQRQPVPAVPRVPTSWQTRAVVRE